MTRADCLSVSTTTNKKLPYTCTVDDNEWLFTAQHKRNYSILLPLARHVISPPCDTGIPLTSNPSSARRYQENACQQSDDKMVKRVVVVVIVVAFGFYYRVVVVSPSTTSFFFGKTGIRIDHRGRHGGGWLHYCFINI
jgi:hypothetical protein